MKRDIFRRGVRMQHQFGETEKINDPLGNETFEVQWPRRIDTLSRGSAGNAVMAPLEVQRQGEYNYRQQSSPISKPNGGFADINGPKPDYAQIYGMPIPVGTKRRLGPLKTDK